VSSKGASEEAEGGRVLPGCSPHHKIKIKKKKTDFVEAMISNVLCYLSFSCPVKWVPGLSRG